MHVKQSKNLQSVTLGLLVQVSSEKTEKVVHLSLEKLVSVSIMLLFARIVKTDLLVLCIVDGISKCSERIAHLTGSDRCGGVLESL